MAEPLLATTGLTRNFGALAAVAEVSLAVAAGAVHAVIGPNGAGKTTLINLLSGDLAPTAGRVSFRGQDITALPPHRISRLGIGRSYQKTNVFAELTALENCMLAAQSRRGHSFQFVRSAAREAAIQGRAEAALMAAGLGSRAPMPATALSHGEQRQLEIAMILATEPALLLLDEPMAGMGAEESARLVALIRALAPLRTVVLIEHDMDAVFAVADRITVMVGGRVLETGTPEAIRASPAVQTAYLGEGDDGG
ncbi:MAG: ABC transporter ATP-binding protein [Alphaproteobacteria bacterium]|nr:ABC transporter ATP-binding protein [Alphaproteobacteria bacterium]